MQAGTALHLAGLERLADPGHCPVGPSQLGCSPLLAIFPIIFLYSFRFIPLFLVIPLYSRDYAVQRRWETSSGPYLAAMTQPHIPKPGSSQTPLPSRCV